MNRALGYGGALLLAAAIFLPLTANPVMASVRRDGVATRCSLWNYAIVDVDAIAGVPLAERMPEDDEEIRKIVRSFLPLGGPGEVALLAMLALAAAGLTLAERWRALGAVAGATAAVAAWALLYYRAQIRELTSWFPGESANLASWFSFHAWTAMFLAVLLHGAASFRARR